MAQREKVQVRVRKVNIPVVVFKEGRSYIVYSHAFDLSSCGGSIQKAQKRFENAVDLFLDELEEMGTLEQVLRELGWQKQERPRQEWIPPSVIKRTHMRVGVPYHA